MKILLYQGMMGQGVTKAELAHRQAWHLPLADQVLDFQYRSWTGESDLNLGVSGRESIVTTIVSARPPITTATDSGVLAPYKHTLAPRPRHEESGEGKDRK